MSHTKGEWKICSVTRRTILGEQGQTIAECRGLRVEAEANARLIAAAPELLDACKSWVKVLECHKGFAGLIRKTKAAIDAAEGQK